MPPSRRGSAVAETIPRALSVGDEGEKADRRAADKVEQVPSPDKSGAGRLRNGILRGFSQQRSPA